MKVIARTDEYTIYKKRNERYAIRNAARAWVNGNEKVAILLEHKLIEAPAPKAPAPEAEEAAAEEATAAADEESTEQSAEAATEDGDVAEGDAEAEAK